jgi:2-hydroxychromene-2-carboxylate isomerase
MTETLDYYFWISSDWAYFGNPRMRDMAQRHGLEIRYRPIDMTDVYARTGGVKLQFRSKERQDYRFVEMRRFSQELNMPIVLKPQHPIVDGRLASRFLIAAEQQSLPLYDLNHAIMHARWHDDQNIEDENVLIALAQNLGLDGRSLLNAACEQAAHDQYTAYTEEAIQRGVWGSPFYVYRDEPFWGQDRLQHLERAIVAAR